MKRAIDYTLLPPDRKTAQELGVLYFFDGKPCRNGHVSHRSTLTKSCIECARLRTEKYKNTEKAKQKVAERIARKRAANVWTLETANRYFRHTYGITLAQYDEMFKSQNGACAICLKPEVVIDKKTNSLRRLAVDHCHTTNKIRGLLCYACNTSIGKMNDDPEVLERAAQYIRNEGVLNCQRD